MNYRGTGCIRFLDSHMKPGVSTYVLSEYPLKSVVANRPFPIIEAISSQYFMFRAVGRQTFPYRIIEGLSVIRLRSRRIPYRFSTRPA